MHLLHPVMQAVDDHAADRRLVGIQRVARAAVVGITGKVPFVIRVENVVILVVQAAKAEGWPRMVAFGGMVVDHVENDLDAGAVQGLDHVTELVDGPLHAGARAVSCVRCEK